MLVPELTGRYLWGARFAWGEQVGQIRLLRLLRLLRLFTMLAGLQTIVDGLYAGLSSIFYISLLLGLVTPVAYFLGVILRK